MGVHAGSTVTATLSSRVWSVVVVSADSVDRAGLDEVEPRMRCDVMESVREIGVDASLVLEIVRVRCLLGFSAKFSCEDWILEPVPSLAGDPDAAEDVFLNPDRESVVNWEETRLGILNAVILTLPEVGLNDADGTVVRDTDGRGFVALCASLSAHTIETFFFFSAAFTTPLIRDSICTASGGK